MFRGERDGGLGFEYVYTSSLHICSLVRHLYVEGDRITIT